MGERLQKALQLLLRGQDSDSVNHFFTSALCGEGEYAEVDLIRGTVHIIDSEDGKELKFIRFAIGIEEIPAIVWEKRNGRSS